MKKSFVMRWSPEVWKNLNENNADEVAINPKTVKMWRQKFSNRKNVHQDLIHVCSFILSKVEIKSLPILFEMARLTCMLPSMESLWLATRRNFQVCLHFFLRFISH